MGSGLVSKEKFFNDGKPTREVRCTSKHAFLFGGPFITCNEHINYLKANNVGMIVTLTIEPIKSGLNINHVPHSFDDTEWTFVDDSVVKSLVDFELLHVPIADSYFITEDNKNKLCDGIKSYHEKNPNKKVYVHCWTGKGRTSLAICVYLWTANNLTLDEVKLFYPNICVSSVQEKYLTRKSLSKEEYKYSEPVIRTPADHACYRAVAK